MEILDFSALAISEPLKKALAEMGFTAPTEIQTRAIPPILEGKDVIGRSHTGTGKTAAFGLPAIEGLDPSLAGKVQVLILCPTRELAMQANGEIQKFARYLPGVKTAAIYGGAPIDRQIFQLKSGPGIVIGTPGRVMDHMRRRTLKLNHVKMVVLDEADEMLNMGFREDIETILTEVPEERQTILFSATMPPAIMSITQQYQKSPVLVEVGDNTTQIAANIEQFYYECPMGRKMDVLNLLLRMHNPKLSIVFCNTKMMVDELAEYLNSHGFKAAGIHGDMKQLARTQVMNNFKSHRTAILIATDVAARGIDVENVDAVFNYDIPQDIEYYVHRIGRTARAGKEGRAFTLISGRKQFYQIRDIQQLTGAKIALQAIPSAEKIADENRRKFLEDIEENLGVVTDQHLTMVDTLVEHGHDLRQIAGTLLGMLYKEQKLELPQIFVRSAATTGDGKGPGKAIGKMSGIVMGIGRQQRIAPNYIVGAIADATGLSGKEVGKIDIYDDYTVVQMSMEAAGLAVTSMESLRINGHKTTVRLIEGKDNFTPKESTFRRPTTGDRDRRPYNKPREGFRKDAYPRKSYEGR